MRLQTDELSIPARELVPLLQDLSATDARGGAGAAQARWTWDHVMAKSSVAAGIYAAWEGQLRTRGERRARPGRACVCGLSLHKTIETLMVPAGRAGCRTR